MKIDRLILGDFETNCYVVRADGEATDCLVIDSGLDSTELLDFLEREQITPVALILTHGHADHIVGVPALRQRYPEIRVYIHRQDADLLGNPEANLSILSGLRFQTDPADVLLADGETVSEAGITLKVLHTPGHTPGGICLYEESQAVVFAGDTLFAGGVGRSDFPGGDDRLLIESIRRRLLTLPPETVVYPGHAMRTTIAREKTHNPFLA